jgi:hypothetical protein
MKKIMWFGINMLLLWVLLWNCDSPTKDEDKFAILSGQVLNSETLVPVTGAVVVVLEYPQVSTLTEADGTFNLELEVAEATDVQLRAFKESFVSDTISILATPGRTVNSLSLSLEPTGSTPVVSGSAASIILYSVNPPAIGVRESGSPEVAEVTYQVQDSSGVPVDLEHSVTVNFLLGSTPGGGVFVSPMSSETGANGLATTSLFSGDSAGVVQIIAEVGIGGQTVRSKPVPVAIHGGLPDSAHFSLAVKKLNFAGYNIYGLTDQITAYVGDKYGNPVKPGTAVYFTTTGGIIEGSALTDDVGQASVNLISSAPKPIHPLLGAGFATITGRTADENQHQIESYATVLFSGIPQISVSPMSINVPDKGSQVFYYTVSDQNDNPLVEGTSISVTVVDGKVKANGNTSMSLPDTQSPSWASFSFTLTDADVDSNQTNSVSVKISTSGPNGKAEYTLSGVAH